MSTKAMLIWHFDVTLRERIGSAQWLRGPVRPQIIGQVTGRPLGRRGRLEGKKK